jgi:hypothetical protein
MIAIIARRASDSIIITVSSRLTSQSRAKIAQIRCALLLAILVLIRIIFDVGALLFRCILSDRLTFQSLKRLELDLKVMKYHRKTYT